MGVLAVCAVLVLRPGRGLEPLKAAAQAVTAPSSGLEILEVRPSFFVIAGAGANIGVQVGEDGVVVVDAGSAAGAPGVLAAIKRISPKPIRYVIDTGPDADHVGGNETLVDGWRKTVRRRHSGRRPAERREPSWLPSSRPKGVLRHMAKSPAGGWPTEVFHYSRKAMYLNGEAIEVLHQPAAHTDSDVFAFFRRSDVVIAGDVLDTRQFPVIDVERGGSIQGEIAALNRLADLAVASVPVVTREAGTIVVPGHGRLCDQYDVVEYRDMVTIIRDRVRDLMKAGRSLAEVKAAQPAKGYMGRYGNPNGALDHGSLHRGRLPEPREGEVVRTSAAAAAPCSSWPLLDRQPCARNSSRRRREAGARQSADRPHRLLGVVRDRELAVPDGDAAKGEYRRIPSSRAALPLINAWDPAADERAGNQCKSYGAGAIMSVPGRLHITWQDADTLRIETDAGTQTRLFHFAPRTTGSSPGATQLAGGIRGGVGTRGWTDGGGSLRVVTSNLRAGYLRKNGVPYGERATVTEHFDVAPLAENGRLLLVTTIVEDPEYLTGPYVVSPHFKKEPDGSKWDPTPCSSTW